MRSGEHFLAQELPLLVILNNTYCIFCSHPWLRV